MSDLFDAAIHYGPLGGSLLGFILLAQAHCAAMCGPFVATFAKSKSEFVVNQLGRVLSYTILGFAVAAVGYQLRPHPFAVAVMCFAAAVAIGVSILSLFGLQVPEIPILGSSLQRFSSYTLGRIFRFGPGKLRSVLLGLATPLIPCGQLWLVLGFASLRADPLEGALVGFVFALATIPGVYGFTWIRDRVALLPKKRMLMVRTFATAILVAGFTFSATMFARTAMKNQISETTQAQPTAAPRCH